MPFSIPPNANAVNTVLAINLNVDGEIESLTKTVPVLHTPQLTVYAFPESGELICDVENRVYFTVLDEKGVSVNMNGHLRTLGGRTLKEVTMQTNGQGILEDWIPHKHERYQFDIVNSITGNDSSNHTVYLACKDGIRMRLDSIDNLQTISLSLFSKQTEDVRVSL